MFLAVLVTALCVAAIGLALVHASVERSFARYVSDIELSRLGVFAAQLEADYRQRGGWPPLSDDARAGWLKAEFARMLHSGPGRLSGLVATLPPEEAPPPLPSGVRLRWPPPDPMALQDRVGLLDAAGRPIAGMTAPPEMRRRPLKVAGQVVGFLTLVPVAEPADALAQTFRADQSRNFLRIALVCVVLSALAAAVLAAHLRAPIVRLVAAARALTAGRFATRVDIRRSDELGVLAASFNHLALMLERHEGARRQWVADTSHELRTPLAVLRAQIEALQDGVRQPDAAQLAAMHRQVQTLGRLIDELYELARADVGQLSYHMAPLDAWALVCNEVDSFRDRFVGAGLRLECLPGASVPLVGDADRLRQIVGNLLENSLQYTDPGGCVQVSAALRPGFWTLRLDDSPPGVPEALLPQLAERFFRVEASRSRAHGGSGLGLALCARIAHAHGGGLRFAASPLGGLRVEVDLEREEG